MDGANFKADLRGKKLTTPEVAKRMLRFKREETSALLFGENMMKYVPKDIGLFVNVTVLHLNKNQLTNLPDVMQSLVKLVTFFAENNQIKQVFPVSCAFAWRGSNWGVFSFPRFPAGSASGRC